MEFCGNCNNMLYISSNDDNNLVKYCKHCNFKKEETDKKCIKVSDTLYSYDDLLYYQNINKYLRHDPTLRRIKDENINCPNNDCNIEKDNQQILYIKYDNKNMKYLYVCDHCGHICRENI